MRPAIAPFKASALFKTADAVDICDVLVDPVKDLSGGQGIPWHHGNPGKDIEILLPVSEGTCDEAKAAFRVVRIAGRANDAVARALNHRNRYIRLPQDLLPKLIEVVLIQRLIGVLPAHKADHAQKMMRAHGKRIRLFEHLTGAFLRAGHLAIPAGQAERGQSLFIEAGMRIGAVLPVQGLPLIRRTDRRGVGNILRQKFAPCLRSAHGLRRCAHLPQDIQIPFPLRRGCLIVQFGSRTRFIKRRFQNDMDIGILTDALSQACHPIGILCRASSTAVHAAGAQQFCRARFYPVFRKIR